MISGFIDYMSRYIVLTEEERAVLSELLEVRRFDKKARLTDIGEVEQNLNYVVKGLIRKYFFRGKEQVIKHIAYEGTLLASSVSYFSRVPSSYIVETIDPSIVVSISRDNLERLRIWRIWERAGRLMMADFH
jgi:CRP-like cAMP-binding protein